MRKRVSAAGVMVVVAGLFASLALPAYAQVDDPAAQARAASTDGQQLSVDDAAGGDAAVADTVVRGDYGVSSAAEIQSLRAIALRDQNLAAYIRSGAVTLGDDYPWPGELTDSQGGGLSPLRYYYRECVDFVAWRLYRDAGRTSAPFSFSWGQLLAGDGNDWKSYWASKGWASGTVPQVGSVAYFAGANHVAYVTAIATDGGVVLEEYNMGGSHGYGQRIIDAGSAYYLYAPPA